MKLPVAEPYTLDLRVPSAFIAESDGLSGYSRTLRNSMPEDGFVEKTIVRNQDDVPLITVANEAQKRYLWPSQL